MKTTLQILITIIVFNAYSQVQIGQDIIGEGAGNQSAYSLSFNESGTRVTIGAIFNNNSNSESGHVRVFQINSNGQWIQLGQDIDGEVDQGRFGNSCSLNNQGNILVVGAPRNTGNGTNAGHVRVYSLDSSNQWIQLGQDIDAEAAFDQFGFSVDINGNGETIVIGAPTNDAGGSTNNNRGHVRVYSLSVGNQWVQLSSDIDGLADGDRLGSAVGINDSGDRLVIGIPENDDNGTNAGQVKVYQLISGNWVQQGQDVTGIAGSQFGASVDINNSGDRIIVGAPESNSGSAFIYELNGNQWTQVGQTIEGDSSGDDLGTSVSIKDDGSIVSVGAPSLNGYAKTFELVGSNWNALGNTITGGNNSFTGFAVELNGEGDRVVVGSPFDNSSGTARIYQFNEPPIISNCPANITQNNDINNCNAIVSWTLPMASDTDGTVTSFTSTHNPGDTFLLGTTTVTYTATDDTGVISTCSFDVVVTDNEPPEVVTQNITVQLDANGQATLSVSDIDNGSSDNCLITSFSLDTTSFDCSDLGNNIVTLSATDTSGNTQMATATVAVVDNIAPIAIAQDITVELGAGNTVSITATDIDSGSNDNCAVSSLALDITNFDCGDVGQNTVTLTVTDSSGNIATATATVTVEEDPAQPLNAIAQDITVELDANGLASIIPQDIDDGSGSGCNSSPTLTLNRTDFNCDDIGQVTVTLTVTDGSITDSDTVIVTVVDNISPQITCPTDSTVAPDNSGLYSLPDYWSLSETLANDNCLVNFSSRSQTPLPGTQLTDGTYTISFGVEDNTGNVGSCDFTLIVDESLSNGDYNLASIALIPNPVKEELTITNLNNIQLNYLNIYDLSGRLVKREVFSSNSSQTKIDLSLLPSAVYFVKLYSQSRTIVKKIVKK